MLLFFILIRLLFAGNYRRGLSETRVQYPRSESAASIVRLMAEFCVLCLCVCVCVYAYAWVWCKCACACVYMNQCGSPNSHTNTRTHTHVRTHTCTFQLDTSDEALKAAVVKEASAFVIDPNAGPTK